MRIEIDLLHENPINAEIYGEDDPAQLTELIEMIRVSGYIKPLIINKNYMIISGHRRYRAAKALGMKGIEVEMISKDENQELEILLAENAFREKSVLQRISEGEYYRKVEERKALERQLSGTTLGANLHGGRTNEIVGEKIGMSARSYNDARKVVERIDGEDDSEVKEFLETTLNSSVNAATKLVNKSTEFIHEVIERTSGETKNVSAVVRELETLESNSNHQPPRGQYEVVYIDLTQSFVHDLLKMQFGNLITSNSALLIWASPLKLALAFTIIQKWGFKYRNCMVRKTDNSNEVSSDCQLLLISTKGKCPVLGEQKHQNSGIVMPPDLWYLIKKTYSGDKLEILPDGWQIWGKENQI